MGHHVHPYALQTFSFLITLIVPGAVFALLGGAWFEGFRRSRGAKAKEAVAAWHAPILDASGTRC